MSESQLARRALLPLILGVSLPELRAQGKAIREVQTRVFAAAQGGGSPCPVFPDADDFSVASMKELARKARMEVVFLLRPTAQNADLRIRYFVPDHEMGVSGHATIAGVTVALVSKNVARNPVRVETLSGVFEAAWEKRAEGYRVTLAQNVPVFGATTAPDRAARALGIAVGDIASAESPVQAVSVSRAKLLVPLRNSKTLNHLQPDFEALWRLCEEEKVSGLYPFTRHSDQPGIDAEARQFPLRAGFPEDAATGVAAGALGAYMVNYDRRKRPGHYEFRFAQGYAMGVPSVIEATADCSSEGAITATAIRGTAQITS